MKSPTTTSIIICFFLITSCYERLDFDQLDNFVSKPIFTFSLNYFSLVPYQFFTASGDQQIEISDIFDVKDLQNVYFLDDVVKLDFNAEIKNEFDREVSIVVEFFNKNNDVLYTFTPLVVESKVLDYIFLDEIKIASGDFHDRDEGLQFQDPSHFYSLDIDLFGRGSFFQFINRTTINEGTHQLVNALKANNIDNSEFRNIFEDSDTMKGLLRVTSLYRVKPQDLGFRGALKLTRDF